MRILSIFIISRTTAWILLLACISSALLSSFQWTLNGRLTLIKNLFYGGVVGIIFGLMTFKVRWTRAQGALTLESLGYPKWFAGIIAGAVASVFLVGMLGYGGDSVSLGRKASIKLAQYDAIHQLASTEIKTKEQRDLYRRFNMFVQRHQNHSRIPFSLAILPLVMALFLTWFPQLAQPIPGCLVGALFLGILLVGV